MKKDPFGLGGKPDFGFGPRPSKQRLDQHLRVRDVAEAYSVSESTVKNWIRDGLLPAYRIGKRVVRIDAADAKKLRQKIEGGEMK